MSKVEVREKSLEEFEFDDLLYGPASTSLSALFTGMVFLVAVVCLFVGVDRSDSIVILTTCTSLLKGVLSSDT